MIKFKTGRNWHNFYWFHYSYTCLQALFSPVFLVPHPASFFLPCHSSLSYSPFPSSLSSNSLFYFPFIHALKILFSQSFSLLLSNLYFLLFVSLLTVAMSQSSWSFEQAFNNAVVLSPFLKYMCFFSSFWAILILIQLVQVFLPFPNVLGQVLCLLSSMQQL